MVIYEESGSIYLNKRKLGDTLLVTDLATREIVVFLLSNSSKEVKSSGKLKSSTEELLLDKRDFGGNFTWYCPVFSHFTEIILSRAALYKN